MLEAKLAQNNLNFKCSFMFFLVRARFGPKPGGGEFRPPPNEKRCKKCLMKLGLIQTNYIPISITNSFTGSNNVKGKVYEIRISTYTIYLIIIKQEIILKMFSFF